jgi:Zn-dependent protease
MKFRLLGFPVQVELSFWIIIGLIASQRRDPVAVLTWVGVAFVSILVHELGHALAGRRLGLSPQIILRGMGGLTMWAAGRQVTPWQSIGVSLAGPFAGFALALVLILLGAPPSEAPRVLQYAYRDALWVNIAWGLLNLLPILPLDGGNVMRDALALFRGRQDAALAYKVSAIAAAGLAVIAVMNQYLFAGVFVAYLAWQNYGTFKSLRTTWN